MKKKYIDLNGHDLPDHDGKLIEIKDVGFQFFDINGQGFLHDGSMIELPDGRKQFFMADGKAIIHDGSPIELPNGDTQYFDEDGVALWPVNEKEITNLINKQREAFFKNRIEFISKETPLSNAEIEDLRLALLAAEHPESEDNKFLSWSKDDDYTGLDPISEDTAVALRIFETLWNRVWQKYQLRHKESLSARYVLNQQKKENCIFAGLKSSESMLMDELGYEFSKADRSISIPQDLEINKEGFLIADEKLYSLVKKMGSGEGSKMFIKFFDNAYSGENINIEHRKTAWKHPLFMYRCIASVLWFNKIKERAKTLYNKPAALPLIVNNSIKSIMKKGIKYDQKSGKVLDKNGYELAQIEEHTLKPMPSIDMTTIQYILRPENIKVLSTVNSHRLLRWEVKTVTEQAVIDKIDARYILVDGGYEELARLIGAGSGGKAANQVRDILLWQAAPKRFIFTDPQTGKQQIIDEGNLITFHHKSSRFRHKSSLEIIVGTMLMPHYLYKLINTFSLEISHEALKLVPIVSEPQLVGRPADQGAQLIFQMEVLVEFRKRAKELANNGCIKITKERFLQLAQKSGVNSSSLHIKTIDAWLTGGKDAPPFLQLIEKDHYAFADDFKRQHDFIVQGGNKEITMSEAAKRGIARKNRGFIAMPKKSCLPL